MITVFKYSERRLGSTSSAPPQTLAPSCLLSGGRSFHFPSMILTRIEIRMKDSAWSCRGWSSLLSRRSVFLKSGLTAKLCLWLSVWERKKRWQMADWMGRVGRRVADQRGGGSCAQTLPQTSWPAASQQFLGGILTLTTSGLTRPLVSFVLCSSVWEMFRTRGGKTQPALICLCLKVDFIVFFCFHTSLDDTLLGTFSKESHHLQFVRFECRQLHSRSRL